MPRNLTTTAGGTVLLDAPNGTVPPEHPQEPTLPVADDTPAAPTPETEPGPAAESAPAEDDQPEEDMPEAEEPDLVADDRPLSTRAFKRYVDRTTRRQAELRRAQEELRAQLEWAKQALAAGTQPQQPQASPSPAPQEPAQPPREEDFESITAYSDALLEWKAEQAVQRKWAEREAAEAERRQHEARQAQYERFAATEDAARKAHPDYDAVVTTAAYNQPDTLAKGIWSSEIGGELLYYVQTHPEEARRLARLEETQLYRELGVLERQLQAEKEPARPRSVRPSASAVTRTPTPPTPVQGAQGTPTRGQYQDGMPHQEYRAWRQSQPGYRP